MTVRPLPFLLAASAAAVLLPLTAAAPVAAGGPLPQPNDATHLRLSTKYVSDRAMGGFAYLNCDPAGGTHPAAESACADLAAVDGRFEDLPQKKDGGACTMQYEPVELHATGRWRGKPVEYVSEVYPNPCMAALATGGNVFNF